MRRSAQLQACRRWLAYPLALAVLCGGMLAGSARGESVTGKNSHNGVSLFGEVRAAFESGAVVVAEHRDSDSALAHPDSGPSAMVAPLAFVTAPPLRTEARVDMVSRFEFGTPFGTEPDDRWTFHVEGSASAVDPVGTEAVDAVVSALATARFFVDPITAPVGTTVGQIVFDPIRPLTEKEAEVGAIIRLLLRENTDTVLTLGPGSSSFGYPLTVGRSYEIFANYHMRVPAGMDPPFLVELGATIIPEPSTFALMIFALIAFTYVERQRF